MVSLVCTVLLRSSLISGAVFPDYSPSLLCTLTYFVGMQFNNYSKTMIWSTFLYRLYVSFRWTADPITLQRLICILSMLWGFMLSLSALLLYLVSSSGSESMELLYSRGSHISFCGLSSSLSLGLYVVVYGTIAVELVTNIYILWAFVSRLRSIRRSLKRQFREEAPKHLRQLGFTESFNNDSIMSLHSIRSDMASPSTKNSIENIVKLTRLMMKLTYLISLSLLSGWLYWAISALYPFAVLLYALDVMVNVVALWFILSINAGRWNKAVRRCYTPCFCHRLCPEIKVLFVSRKRFFFCIHSVVTNDDRTSPRV